MLFEASRHEPLQERPWDAAAAHEAVRAIVDDLQESLGTGIGWPDHPLDELESRPTGCETLYLGASGTLWALWYLQQQGAVELRIRPAQLIDPVYQAYLADPDLGEVVPSYFLGEVGILLVHWRLTGSDEAAGRLAAAIERNLPNPTNEALWAAPGTMVAAWHMLAWTGERRWHDLFLANVEQLWRTWLPSEHLDCHLWTQDLYGRIVQLLGAGHGFAGNAYPLLRGAQLLAPGRREVLYQRCVQTLQATAVQDGPCMNWPQGVGPPRPGRTQLLVQWCHGAPGIITGLADFPPGKSAAMDAMLQMAGATIWRAGPLAKGAGLCHGTAGNGYAFLKLHQRNGDARWLARARAFAMHAIGQYQRARQHYGIGRATLWTGDPGLAVYLWHCLQGSGGMPALDLLDDRGAPGMPPALER